jgi:UDPglucose 6-dehydrogenase
MSVESAEMTKHALNAFLATSVVFANEIAALCERTGADAKEVELGLKSDPRIGERAYLAPGAAFSGGTLARDVTFLGDLQSSLGGSKSLFDAVLRSNEAHQQWTRDKLLELVAGAGGQREQDGPSTPLAGKTIAVWGLTYKPGTDTLRRSLAVDLCRWMASNGATVRAHDPAVTSLPEDLAGIIVQSRSPLGALEGASVLVIATEWPEYREVSAEDVVHKMEQPLVIDPNRFLAKTLGMNEQVQYAAVGKAVS